MMKSLVLGGVLGGLVLFAWGSFSYMVLPWHPMSLNKFKDEDAVTRALTANAAGSGMYILPNPHRQDQGLSESQRQAAREDSLTRMTNGPFLFASVSLAGSREMGAALLLTLLGNVVAATLVAWLLAQTAPASYWRRVGFVVSIALVTAVVVHYPSWIWWRFSADYTLVESADALVGWFWAGLAIARIVPAR